MDTIEPTRNKWEYTDHNAAQLSIRKPQQKEMLWGGRKLIGRDTPINKGVFATLGIEEAIVVDDEKDPHLNQTYQELINIRKRAQERGYRFKDGLLVDIYNLVSKKIPYNLHRSEQIRVKTIDKKIILSAFFGGGVCRHQALLTGYLIERLVREGYLKGKVSIDSNQKLNSKESGHAWVRYTNSQGKIIIIDTAQGFLGYLEEARKNNRAWPYERPEDRGKYSPERHRNISQGVSRRS